MCGIAGIHRRGSKPVARLNDLIDNLALAIERRGTDATGYLALMQDGKVQLEKRTLPAHAFIQTRGQARKDARTVLIHTRFATVGAPDDPSNAHPVASGTMAAIHNGTIYNHRELFREYDLPRLATVDSEVVPALLMKHGWDSAAKALGLIDGGAALAIVNTETPDELILARCKSYPMVYMVTPTVVVFASTATAIMYAWQKTYGKPAPGRIVTMPEWTMARVNGKVKIEEMEIPENPNRPARPTFSHGIRGTGTLKGKPLQKKRTRKSKSGKLKVTVRREPLFSADDDWYICRAVEELIRQGWDEDDAWELVDAPPAWSRSVERAENLSLYGTADPM